MTPYEDAEQEASHAQIRFPPRGKRLTLPSIFAVPGLPADTDPPVSQDPLPSGACTSADRPRKT